jgi:hypothetical protein
MLNRKRITKVFAGLLMLTLMALPQLSYADWGHDHFYRWQDHPRYGLHFHVLPAGYFTVKVGFHRYYYYDGLYYNYVGGDYVLVSPPVGAYVNVIPPEFQGVVINGRTYYTNDGVYYILTRHHGYKVVVAPVVYAQPVPAAVVQDTFPVNIPNSSGGYVTVMIKKSGNGFVGPQGEFYADFPKVSQLKAMYAK